MSLLKQLLPPHITYYIYNYYNWYALYTNHITSNQIWEPLYRKYFPKANDPTYNYFGSFFIELKKRLTVLKATLDKYDTNPVMLGKVNFLIRQFIQHDEISIIQYIAANLSKEYLWIMSYTSAKVKNNPDIMLQVIRKNAFYIRCSNKTLQEDYDYIQQGVDSNWEVLKYIGSEFQDNIHIARAAVKQNWKALQYAGPISCNNEEIATIAVKQSWKALQYINERFRNNETIMVAAVRQHYDAIKYVGPNLAYNLTIICASIEHDFDRKKKLLLKT